MVDSTPGRVGFPCGSVGGMKHSSRGLPGLSKLPPPTRSSVFKGLGGGGSTFPSTEIVFRCFEGDEPGALEPLLTEAARSFSVIRSATVPVRRRLAPDSLTCGSLGEEV